MDNGENRNNIFYLDVQSTEIENRLKNLRKKGKENMRKNQIIRGSDWGQ